MMRRPNDVVYGWYKTVRVYRDLFKPEYYAVVDGREYAEETVELLKERLDWALKKQKEKAYDTRR